MPRPNQAVNSRGYPGVLAGATELDIEAVPTSRHLTVRNSPEFNILRNILPNLATSGTLDIIQEPPTLSETLDIIRIILSVFTSYSYLHTLGMYRRLFYSSIACLILTKYSGLLDERERVTVADIIDGGRG